jgi:Fe-S cluster biosynthesis and repair protein YggX
VLGNSLLRFYREKAWFRFSIKFSIILFALVGFFFTTVFVAIKLKLTRDPGAVDFNDRYFVQQREMKQDSVGNQQSGMDQPYILYRVHLLSRHYPLNAQQISDVLAKTGDFVMAEKMLSATDMYLSDNPSYQKGLAEGKSLFSGRGGVQQSDSSLFYWANTVQWPVMKTAIVKDKMRIDSVARLCDLEPRLLVTMLLGEQIRLFDSKREAFKKWIQPLKILVNETTLSLGVMGIKEETAIKIERYLKDKNSVYYPGEKYEHFLDFKTTDIATERFARLTNPKDHTYPYLYAALFLKQIDEQWKRSGYDISKRPEILATLFNLGFEVSKPKPDPQTGGSRINIDGRQYTFGGLGYEFYYSGELAEEFPLGMN